MIDNEKIVVSMTSWTGRMKYDISPTIISILTGTLVPDILYLNLSSTEWNGIEVPEYINELQKQYSNFVVNWVDGPNTKTFKKFLPILENHKNDIIITIDDDVEYPNNFVEEMVKTYKNDSTRPVTVNYFNIDGVLFVWGGASLYKYDFLKGYDTLLDDEIISTFEDDWFYTYVLLLNQIKVQLASDCICYTSWRYPQYIIENSMFFENRYNSQKTKNILDRKLEERGTSFAELADNLWEKYNHRIV